MNQRQLGFGEAINIVLARNYCNFIGRASRSEYWWWVLFMALLGFVIGFILGLFGASGSTVQVIQGIVGLVFLLPGLGVAVRRLHDINKSGWWLFLAFIPLVGAIILIIWFCKPSDSGINAYGDEPYVQY